MSRLIKRRLRSLLASIRAICSPFELVVLPLEFLDVALPSLHLGVDLDGPQSKFFIFESETRTGQRILSFRHTHKRASELFISCFPRLSREHYLRCGARIISFWKIDEMLMSSAFESAQRLRDPEKIDH
jgi:hypothetical protein